VHAGFQIKSKLLLLLLLPLPLQMTHYSSRMRYRKIRMKTARRHCSQIACGHAYICFMTVHSRLLERINISQTPRVIPCSLYFSRRLSDNPDGAFQEHFNDTARRRACSNVDDNHTNSADTKFIYLRRTGLIKQGSSRFNDGGLYLQPLTACQLLLPHVFDVVPVFR
jgi:hypothetical protein